MIDFSIPAELEAHRQKRRRFHGAVRLSKRKQDGRG